MQFLAMRCEKLLDMTLHRAWTSTVKIDTLKNGL
jgi:hypothetical protein